jgi:hypothetical protein
MPATISALASAAHELRAAASFNIRGFETELRENKGSLKTTFGENETALIENGPITSALDHINANG